MFREPEEAAFAIDRVYPIEFRVCRDVVTISDGAL
jgi:hypothetical protein